MRLIKTKTLPYFGGFALVFLVGCATKPYPLEDMQSQIEPTTALIDDLLRKAELSSGNLAVDLRLEAITELLEAGFPERAEAEIKKMQEELKYTKGFLISVGKKLSNDRFVSNAPEKVIEI